MLRWIASCRVGRPYPRINRTCLAVAEGHDKLDSPYGRRHSRARYPSQPRYSMKL
jgi:hypothetical protein